MKREKKILILASRLFSLIFVLLIARYFYIQIILGNELQEEVVNQRVKIIEQIAERGKIYDRNGSILAMSLKANNIAIYPNIIEEEKTKEKIAKILSEELNVTKTEEEKMFKEIMEKFEWKDKNGEIIKWVPIAKRINPEITKEIIKRLNKEKVGGVEISESPKRYYPGNELASSVLGFVNHNNDPGAGVEVSMNNYLEGTSGYNVAETYNGGKVIPIGFENRSSPVHGQDITLTIDSYIQYILEKELKTALKRMEPKTIHGIVMDPNNGDILAMASYPSFDPNNFTEYKSSLWNNSAAKFVYEPGSTIKPIFMAMALEEEVIDETVTYTDPGYIDLYNTRLYDWNKEGWGTVGLKEIIVHSSNVGMVRISQQMTEEQIIKRLDIAGFGRKSGIKLTSEEIGLVPTAKSLKNDPIRKATISYGQGIAVTPLQLITSFSEIINGGYDINARLVTHVEDKFGNIIYQKKQPEIKQIYNEGTSQLMKEYLKANMEEGSGVDSQISGYESGGKTGSAWVYENGNIKEGAIIGSMLGFAPYENPRFAVLIVVEEPKGVEFGSEAAGPIFKNIMEEVLRYYSIPRKNENEAQTIEIPNVKMMVYDEAKKIIENSYNFVSVIKEGYGEVVVDQKYIYNNHQLYVTLITKKIVEKEMVYMPKMYGMTKKEIIDLLKPYETTIKFHGEGKVIEQNIKEGIYIKKQNIQDFIFWTK